MSSSLNTVSRRVFSRFASSRLPLSLAPLAKSQNFSFGSFSGAPPSLVDSAHKPQTTAELLMSRGRPSLEISDSHGHRMAHPIWSSQFLKKIEFTHVKPENFVDKLALATINLIRFNFDWMSGYSFLPLNERRVLRRVIFLETIAGIPGSVAGTLRHLMSLRTMKRDGGWIHSLLMESENERMHLLTFMKLAPEPPSILMKSAVFLSQGIFFNFFWMAYMISPRFCHKLVGYLEEEAVRTYTKILEHYDAGKFPLWKDMKAPPIAINYWQLPETANVRDLIEVVRADEAHHRDSNHLFGSLKPDDLSPFRAGH